MAKNNRTICGFCGREFSTVPGDFLPSGFEGMGICGPCLRAGNAALQSKKGGDAGTAEAVPPVRTSRTP